MASTPVVWIGVTLALIFGAVGIALFIRGIVALSRTITAGTPDHTRTDHAWQRLWTALADTLTHRTFKGKPLVRIAHWLVMVSFVVLIATLARSVMQLTDPHANLPLIGNWVPWLWVTEAFAWLGILGIVALMIVRQVVRRQGTDNPRLSRFFGSTGWQAYFVEWVILLVCACVLVLHGLDYALTNGDLLHFPTTAWLGRLLSELPESTLENLVVTVSALKIVVSASWMAVIGMQTSMGVAWHRFLAPLNLIYGRDADGSKALGPLAPLLVDGRPLADPDDLDDVDDDTVLGLGTSDDLTWKDRLDLYSCTECGRCQDVCPAWNTNKPLSPKLLTLAMRDNLEGHSSLDVLGALAASGMNAEGMPGPGAPLVPDVVGSEALWDCTMCGACVEQCPVDIEHVDRIAGLRRFQVLMESAFPRELARPFKGMETKGNPYGQMARKRLDWAKNLDFEVPVIGQDVEDASEVDYLFWVGCAGAFDDRAKKTTAAVAELLHTAGVSFAVLGSGESCTGDPARRAGNEPLFQMLAQAAIETLTEAKAQRIVVTCAHCFNTIAGEFPELGGHFEVIHHTQLLSRLVREKLLQPVAPPPEESQSITYHDPCFLGRHNRVFEAPRELLGGMPGVELREMPRNRENALCCGAGGARAWMEETRGSRIADLRMGEAAATGADVVATACPFCTQMLDTASSAIAGDSHAKAPVVKDVAQLLLEGVRRGRPGNHPRP